MAKPAEKKPTERELDILQVLWEKGPSTVRTVHDAMNEKTKTGYTTTLKLMQLMAEKGILNRDESAFKHIYSPAMSQEKMQKVLTQDFVDRAFSGSAEKLVMGILTSEKISKEALADIKNMLDALEET